MWWRHFSSAIPALRSILQLVGLIRNCNAPWKTNQKPLAHSHWKIKDTFVLTGERQIMSNVAITWHVIRKDKLKNECEHRRSGVNDWICSICITVKCNIQKRARPWTIVYFSSCISLYISIYLSRGQFTRIARNLLMLFEKDLKFYEIIPYSTSDRKSHCKKTMNVAWRKH